MECAKKTHAQEYHAKATATDSHTIHMELVQMVHAAIQLNRTQHSVK